MISKKLNYIRFFYVKKSLLILIHIAKILHKSCILFILLNYIITLKE